MPRIARTVIANLPHHITQRRNRGEVKLGYHYDQLGRVIKETVGDKEITSHYETGEWHRSQRGGDADALHFAYDLNEQLQQITQGNHQPLNVQGVRVVEIVVFF